MNRKGQKKISKRVLNSWMTSLISISLVLVMLGTLGLMLINARQLSEYVREKIGFTLVLNDDVKDVGLARLQKVLSAQAFVKSINYIDKEAAAKELAENLGEDFTGFLGYNPLFASLEVKLFANYTNPDSLVVLEKRFLEYPQVKEVYYQKNLVTVINENVRKISILLIVVSGLLTFIFVALINNTIRISVYSQRFTINTMQMVGAGNSYIRKPFLQQGLFLGVYGALVANAIILVAISSYEKALQGIVSLSEFQPIIVVFALVTVFGILISLLSTYFAVDKFLRLKFDEMFY